MITESSSQVAAVVLVEEAATISDGFKASPITEGVTMPVSFKEAIIAD
jgi:hypothetical protein